MKNRLIITISTALLILVSLCYVILNNFAFDFSSRDFSNPEFSIPTSDRSAADIQQVMLVIDFGGQEVVSHSAEHEQGITALSLLMDAAEENNIELKTTEYDFGTMVDSIGEKESSSDMAWIYFINGESANVGADSYEVVPGDTIEWRYIEPSW